MAGFSFTLTFLARGVRYILRGHHPNINNNFKQNEEFWLPAVKDTESPDSPL